MIVRVGSDNLVTTEIDNVELTDGKLDVIKKDDIKEMIGRSPDHQDNMLQRIRFEIGQRDYFT